MNKQLSMLKNVLKLAKNSWLLSLALWLLVVTSAQAATELRVAIKKGVKQFQVGSSTNALIKDNQGKILGEIAGMNGFTATSRGSLISVDKWNAGTIWIEPKDNGYVWLGDRWYRGRIRLIGSNGSFTVVNHINLEEYLYSVVGAEAIPSWPLEALKSQAVAARTYALYERSKASGKAYDVDATTMDQVYKGLNSEYVSTHEAVDQTSGQAMTYNGKAILAVFHSSSGGHTENVEDVWMQPLPYLRGVVDYDQSAPVYQWNKSFSPTQLGSLIGGVGAVRAMNPQKTTPQGRIVSMKVVGDRGSKVVTGDQLRKALDLRSTLFSATPNGTTFQIYGKGYGHGIGMSQWGAYGLAEQGTDYRQILGHFYQNATISQVN